MGSIAVPIALLTILGGSPRLAVSAEGTAPVVEGDESNKREALRAAFRNAVRQATESLGLDKAIVARLVKALSQSDVESVVGEYTMEAHEVADGTHQVKIRAYIKRHELLQEWIRRAPKDKRRAIRLFVAIHQLDVTTHQGESGDEPKGNNTAESAFIQEVAKYGVKVVVAPDASLQQARESNDLLREHAQKLGATFAIGGSVKAKGTGSPIMGTRMNAVSSQGRFLAIDVAESTIVSAVGELRGMGMHVALGSAASVAMENVSKDAATQILLGILYRDS